MAAQAHEAGAREAAADLQRTGLEQRVAALGEDGTRLQAAVQHLNEVSHNNAT